MTPAIVRAARSRQREFETIYYLAYLTLPRALAGPMPNRNPTDLAPFGVPDCSDRFHRRPDRISIAALKRQVPRSDCR
jgi:hypothetical protein